MEDKFLIRIGKTANFSTGLGSNWANWTNKDSIELKFDTLEEVIDVISKIVNKPKIHTRDTAFGVSFGTNYNLNTVIQNKEVSVDIRRYEPGGNETGLRTPQFEVVTRALGAKRWKR